MFSFIIIKKHLPAPPNLAPLPSLKLQIRGGSAGVRGFSPQGLPRVAGAFANHLDGAGAFASSQPVPDQIIPSVSSTAPAPLQHVHVQASSLTTGTCCAAACQVCTSAPLPLKCSGMPQRGPGPEPRPPATFSGAEPSQVLGLRRPLGPPGSWILEFRANWSSRRENKRSNHLHKQPGEQCGSLLCNLNSIFCTLWSERRPLCPPQQFASADKAGPANERFNLAGAVLRAPPLQRRRERFLSSYTLRERRVAQ